MKEFDEYQEEAGRTDAGFPGTEGSFLMHALGLGGEAGEYQEVIKKVFFHGKSLDREKAAKELGDALWYLSRAAADLGYKLSEIASMNVEKLRERYKDGFSPEASAARVDVVEDAVSVERK